MGIKTTEKIQKMHGCHYVVCRRNVVEFFDLKKGDLIEVNWLRKVKKRR